MFFVVLQQGNPLGGGGVFGLQGGVRRIIYCHLAPTLMSDFTAKLCTVAKGSIETSQTHSHTHTHTHTNF